MWQHRIHFFHSEAATAGRANLIVGRSANFGGITVVLVSVDGKQVGTIPRDQKYRGALTPGHHVVTATVSPNYLNTPEQRKELDVKAGNTYACWKHDSWALAENR